MNEAEKERNIHIRSRTSAFLTNAMILACDYIMIVVAELIAYTIRSNIVLNGNAIFHIDPIYIFLAIPAIFIFFLHTNSQSLLGRPFWHTVRKTFWDIFYGVVALAVIVYLGHMTDFLSRFFLLVAGGLTLFLVILGRYTCRKVMNKVKLFQLPVIFIGAGKTAEIILKTFDDDVGFGYRIIGFIDDNPVSKKIAERFRILGGFSKAEKIIRRTGVRHVIITAPGISQKEQVTLVKRIQPYVKQVSFVPNLLETPGNLEIINFADAGLLMIKVKNNLASWQNRLFKRTFDIVCCLLGLIFVIPIFFIIAIAIYIDNPGPILFTHKRVGKGGKIFPCYKFRSMCVNADIELKKYLDNNPEARKEWEKDFKLKNDPRVTKVGAFLRKTSLDELPQLINVIKGEMSLVGPRPIVSAEIDRYEDSFKEYAMVLPGITGIWQVNGRSDTTYSERVAMDSWYVHNWSIWLDIWYLVKTVKVVLMQKGAY